MVLDRLLGRGGNAPAQPAGPAGPDDSPAALARELDALIARINAASGRLPTAATVQARRLTDLVQEMLSHQEKSAAPNVNETILITSTVRDYVPTSLDAYLALPAAFLATHRTATGATPDDELLLQLQLLESGIRDTVEAIWAGNAQKLESQGRFLQTKFSRSDLDLP
jgi:hypothetical protein